MSTVTVNLSRPDPSQPWGFRIHGGADFAQPLLIVKVSAGSLSAQQGLVPGDQIIQINGEDALRLRHKEAQQKIIGGGNQVQFQVVRGDSANLERVLINNCSNQPLPGRVSRQSSMKQVSSSTSVKSSSSSVTTSSVIQNSSAVSTTAVTQAWKGPKYSEESIKEMMTSQAEVLQTGAIGVNFMKADEKGDLDMQKSEVLKMLRELEEEQKRKTQAKQGDQTQMIQQQGNSTFGLMMNRGYEASLQAQQSQAPWITPQQSPAPVQ